MPPDRLCAAAAALLTQTGHESTAGLADVLSMSAAGQAHVVPDVGVATERRSAATSASAPREASPVIPLLILVIALAAAAVWFVAMPQLDKPAPVARSCEVIVLESGKTRCVSDPKARSKSASRKAKPANR